MIITCPNCSTSYQVADGRIGEDGRTVRCAKCSHSWTATPDGAAAPPEPDSPVEAVPETPADFETEPVAEPEPEPEPEPGPEPEPEPEPEETVPPEPFETAPRSAFETEAPEAPEPPPLNIRRRRLSEYVDSRDDTRPLTKVLAWLVFAAVVVAIFGGVYKYRQQFIELWPPAVRIYETLGIPVDLPAGWGLTIKVEQTRRDTDLGDPTLVLEGTIENGSSRTRPVPSVRVTLLAGSRPVQEWSFVPDKRSLEAGESVAFVTSVRKPDPSATDVHIVFYAGE
ncbi:MAG: DUF3426 domain-containing protein [Alphaproteobacteria bacterium]